jgi:hypothetical protein
MVPGTPSGAAPSNQTKIRLCQFSTFGGWLKTAHSHIWIQVSHDRAIFPPGCSRIAAGIQIILPKALEQ